MSLTSLLRERDVIERFSREFHYTPEKIGQLDLIAPPVTNHYAVVGTAFDYLLRFYLKRINPDAVTRPWVAETAARILDKLQYSEFGLGNLDIISSFLYGRAAIDAEYIISAAKQSYSNFLNSDSDQVSDDLIVSALCLAQLDVIYRSKFRYLLETKSGKVWKRDVKDLRRLIAIVDMGLFKASETCFLNPTFGEASKLADGADADIIIDGRLIDIKTTKSHHFNKEYFHQLIGYYSLSQIGGVDGSPFNYKIETFEIYYSRFGYLRRLNVDEVINKKTFPRFLVWFSKRMKAAQRK